MRESMCMYPGPPPSLTSLVIHNRSFHRELFFVMFCVSPWIFARPLSRSMKGLCHRCTIGSAWPRVHLVPRCCSARQEVRFQRTTMPPQGEADRVRLSALQPCTHCLRNCEGLSQQWMRPQQVGAGSHVGMAWDKTKVEETKE